MRFVARNSNLVRPDGGQYSHPIKATGNRQGAAG